MKAGFLKVEATQEDKGKGEGEGGRERERERGALAEQAS